MKERKYLNMTGLTMMKFNDVSKMVNALNPYKVKCKCGHSVHIIKRDRVICDWCGHWVYKDKLTEMKYELEKRGIYGRR